MNSHPTYDVDCLRVAQSPEEEMDHVEEKKGEGSWQAKALRVLHSGAVQNLFIALLLLDVLVLFAQLGKSRCHGWIALILHFSLCH